MPDYREIDFRSEVPISFINDFQDKFFHETKRNQCASGGYGNGKTTVLCQKALFLAASFPRYQVAVFRKKAKELKNSTVKTFFEVCPPALYSKEHGGRRADSFGELTLVNGSHFVFTHLENYDHGFIRGLEINCCVIDQGEEIDEEVYLHLDSRVGRWSHAELAPWMNPDDFKKHPVTGRPLVPSYMLVGCNPDDLDHWIYERYHPESEYYHKVQKDPRSGEPYRLSDSHVMHQAESTTNIALDDEVLRTYHQRSKSFIRRFVKGEWGILEGYVHQIDPLSLLDNPDKSLIETALRDGKKYRVLDHGTSAPTCCLWFVVYKEWTFCYREYYKPNDIISNHRQAINRLSRDERYAANFIDPACNRKELQGEHKDRAYSVIDAYANPDKNADNYSPGITFLPADNNELVTRDRVDELLKIDVNVSHPVTGEKGAPRLYFIRRSDEYPEACSYAIKETKLQRKVKIDEKQGEPVFGDERETGPRYPDHAYDCVRYFCGTYAKYHEKKVLTVHENSFYAARRRVIRARRSVGAMNRF